MSQSTLDPYEFSGLSSVESFRIAELLPGIGDAPISVTLHPGDWDNPPEYEAVSYAWGDVSIKGKAICHGKLLEVSLNLKSALEHLRLPDKSRFLWVDVLCINQTDTPERSSQVRQMRKIYQMAQKVLIWLGKDEENQAKSAIASVNEVSQFLLERLGLTIADLRKASNLAQTIYNARTTIPLPNELPFARPEMWQPLVWLYSHTYFTRVWVIQEVNANTNRSVLLGYESVEWERVDLVAAYVVMETAFSKKFGFSKAYCWFASMVSQERIRNPQNWLFMLYLSSNFSSLDNRDAIYGLRGLMNLSAGSRLLEPDYGKSTTDVYRDSVEAAFLDFGNTDVLLYLAGNEDPSWIPRWDRPMLFRNPFRFGKPLAWKPAGGIGMQYSIDKGTNTLQLSGIQIDVITAVEQYNEMYFGNAMTQSEEGLEVLSGHWHRILSAISASVNSPHSGMAETTLPESVITNLALALSYGLDADANQASPDTLLPSFVAYLYHCLASSDFTSFVPSSLRSILDVGSIDPHAFGKPVWDFKYPDSSIFITKEQLIGCSVAGTAVGDIVMAPLGCTYPCILRPMTPEAVTPQTGSVTEDLWKMRGYAFVSGIMSGERANEEQKAFYIR